MPADRKQPPTWVRYSSLGFQLAVVIVGLTLLGAAIDRRYDIGPWGTLSGFGIGLFGGLYFFVRSAQEAMRAAGRSDRRAKDDQNG